MTSNTYECTICLNINHASKLHCSTCGTIPAQYSVLGIPSVFVNHIQVIGEHAFNTQFIPSVIAKGADRVEWHHNSKVYLRTVPADYYATE